MGKPSDIIFDGSKSFGTIYLGNLRSIPPKDSSTQIKIDPKASASTMSLPTQEIRVPRFALNFRPFLMTLSTGFIAISFFGLLTLFWPVLIQELRYNLILSHQSSATDQKILTGFPQGDQWVPSNTTFSIVIPKIDAKAVILANVDTSNEREYMEALKKGVAHAKGTCFPGMDCWMYLFAHSTNSPLSVSRYNAVFYLLRKLEKGDPIIIYFYGKKILYEVTGKEIVSPSDTRYITKKGGEELLVLQTCDPPGTTINRLLVFAKPRVVEYLK